MRIYENPLTTAEAERVNRAQYNAALWRLLMRENPNMLVEVLLVCGPPKDWGDSNEWYRACAAHLVDRYGWEVHKNQTRRACEILFTRIEQMLWEAERESQQSERETRGREVCAPEE